VSQAKYRTIPETTPRMPGGVPFIIGNEFAERFSFYGMKAILAIFMTRHLMGSGGQLDTMTDVQATKWIHVFVAAVYLTPLLGGLLADLVWGKYRTIIWLSIIYCLGHLALALDDTRIGLGVGLGLIALGAGGIKPCVSAHVGDQFGKSNAHFLPRIFSWFYFAINFGSAISTVLTPWVLEQAGPNWAFGIPGALMLLATLVFWAGRWRFAHIPPQPRVFVRELFTGSVLRNLGMLMVMYWFFVAMFWALFDQTASRWVLQAEHMNRNLFGFELLSSQLQAANPLLVMIMIPLFSYLLYPLANRFFRVTPLKKMALGFFVAVPAFALPAVAEQIIQDGGTPSILWQLWAYVLLTAAEVLISITCLEFSYSQAPNRLKSFVMSLYMTSVFAGNLFVALVNGLIEHNRLPFDLSGAKYYWFFTIAIGLTGIAFSGFACFYRPKTYIQGDDDTDALPAAA
jgi:POT family proton-dependent oligopeptide transporter